MTLKSDLSSALKSIGKDWKRVKRQTDKEDRVSFYHLSRMRYRPPHVTIREVAFEVMEGAYQKASGGKRYPANARQIYYAARPSILQVTGTEELDSQYFTQILLKDYMEIYKPPDWDVVFDARGHFSEPHTKKMIGLGGLEVREYISGFTDGKFDETPENTPKIMIPTKGPRLRFGAVLFIEKEGFRPLLDAAQIEERYDVGITSSKGMPVSALSDLLYEMHKYGIKGYCVHDFDKSGFSILSTLRKGTRGSKGSGDIIDLGFRLSDISGLERERVSYGHSDPSSNLRGNGATKEEIDILLQGRWWGQRVELNAMTSDQFIEWLERNLQEHGVEKVIPDKDTLDAAYRRAVFLQRLQKEEEKLRKKMRGQTIPVPDSLSDRVNWIMSLKDAEHKPWDEIIWGIASQGKKAFEPFDPTEPPRDFFFPKKEIPGESPTIDGTSPPPDVNSHAGNLDTLS